MERKFYYVVVSFMLSDKEGIRRMDSLTLDCSDGQFFPVTECVKFVENKAKNAIPATIQVDTVIEISEADYNAFNERAKELGMI